MRAGRYVVLRFAVLCGFAALQGVCAESAPPVDSVEQALMDRATASPSADARRALAEFRTRRAEELAVTALATHKADDYLLALAYAESATALDPKSADAWWVLGRLSYEWAEKAAPALMAEDAFRRTVELDGSRGAARLLLAELLSKQGRFDAALEQYEAAVTSDPSLGQPPVITAMCVAYLMDFQWERGQAFCAKMLKRDAKADAWRIARAILVQRQGRQAEADRELQRVIERKDAPEWARGYARSVLKDWAGEKTQ